MTRTLYRIAVATLLSALLGGCWSLENPLDPARCADPCGAGSYCLEGACVPVKDGGASPDGKQDAAPDQAPVDRGADLADAAPDGDAGSAADSGLDGDLTLKPDAGCKTNADCDDKLTCTTDTCSKARSCVNAIKTGFCLIGGVCRADGNGPGASGNPCHLCSSSKSSTSWSFKTRCVYTLTGGAKGNKDGNLKGARFNTPTGIALDPAGELYVGDTGNGKIRLIKGNKVTTVVGNPKVIKPAYMDLDKNSLLYVTDGPYVRTVTTGATPKVTILAGDGTHGYLDGQASKAQFGTMYDILEDGSSTVYVTDGGNRRIRRITSGQVYTFAGNGQQGINNGQPSNASFHTPRGLAYVGGSSPTLYIADLNYVRKVQSNYVDIHAGNGNFTNITNGYLKSSSFNQPYSLATNTGGGIYVGDIVWDTVRLVGSSTVSGVAGPTTTGQTGCKDGQGAQATFSAITSMVVDASTTIYLVDRDCHAVRVITP